jgi:hypothetical protein
MSLQSAQGTISILSSDTVGTTKVVSGLGFAPVALFFYWSGTASAVDVLESLDVQEGFGVATGAAARRCVSGFSQNGVTTTVTEGGYHNAAVACTMDAAGFTGLLDIQSFDAGGFTAIIDDQFPVNMRVQWMAIGGSDVANASVGSFQQPVGAGDQDIVDAGFQPNFIMVLHGGRTASGAPNTTADVNLTIGAYDGTTQGVLAVGSQNAVTTTATMRYCRAGEIAVEYDGSITATSARASATAFLANGFRLNWAEVAAAQSHYFYLALNISTGKRIVGNLLTRTDGADIVESGFGFTPEAAMFFAAGAVENAADTPVAHNVYAVGAAVSPSSRGAIYASDKNAVTTTECRAGVEYDEVYIEDESLSGTVTGLMDLKSMDSDGLTCVMDDPSSTAFFVWYFAFGEAAVGGPTDLSWVAQGASAGISRIIMVG